MTDQETAELLACLGQLRREWPEVRFGQMIANLAVVARGTDAGAAWDIEDEELLAAARRQLAELSHRGSKVAPITAGGIEETQMLHKVT